MADAIRHLSLIIQVKENTVNFDEFCKAIASIVTGANYDPRREMHFIDPKTVRQEAWTHWGECWIPKSVSSTCPHCEVLTTFALTPRYRDAATLTVDLHGDCPSCNQLVSFFALGCTRVDQGVKDFCQSIWMHPIPKVQKVRTSIIDKELVNNPEVIALYEDALICFNAKLWRASVTQCALALESIAKEKFTSDEKKILKGITEGKYETDIPKALYLPIIKLTQAIRTGRTSGTHLDYTKAANEEIASKMLSLTEYALRYFYEMPLAIQSINALIELPIAPI